MAAAENSTPTKRTRKAGPRVSKPFHLLVEYTDESGAKVPLRQGGVTITAVKDPAVLLQKMVTGGMDGAAYVTFTPTPEKPAAPAA